MRALVRMGLVAMLGMGSLLVAASPASAHDVCAYAPELTPDPGGVACVSSNAHSRISVGDLECDQHSVVAQFYVRQGIPEGLELRDDNGCDNALVIRNLGSGVTRFRVCVEGVACSRWVTA